jgi:hypothetical protein
VTTYAVHPGVVATDIWRAMPALLRPLIKLAMLSTEEGAATTLHCATTAAVAGESGLYYDRCKPRMPSGLAQDAALAALLWTRSEAWVREAPAEAAGSTVPAAGGIIPPSGPTS